MSNIQVEFAYYSNNRSTPLINEYELKTNDRLCFTCSLPECKDGTKSCPRTIANNE